MPGGCLHVSVLQVLLAPLTPQPTAPPATASSQDLATRYHSSNPDIVLNASARHPHPTDAHSRGLAPLRPRPPFPAVSCEIASLLSPILVLLLQSILPTGMQGRGCKESCCEQEMRGPREQSEGLGWPPVPGLLRAGFILQPMLS